MLDPALDPRRLNAPSPSIRPISALKPIQKAHIPINPAQVNLDV